MTKKNYDSVKIKSDNSKVLFKDGYALLSYDIYKTYNDTLYFHFTWDVSNSGLKYLSHEFKVITKKYDKEISFNSMFEGSFEIGQLIDVKIMHTYEYYGEKNWYDLIYL